VHAVTRLGTRARSRIAAAAILAWLADLPAARATQEERKNDVACTLETESAMAFGAYDTMINSPLDQQGRVSFRCYKVKNETTARSALRFAEEDASEKKKVIVHIAISAGTAGNFNRHMAGADSLHYNIYLDGSRQMVWGDGTAGTAIYAEEVKADNQTITVPVFGRVFGGQDVRAGEYRDNLVVTLDF
jgi:spore coat protein U-like protein